MMSAVSLITSPSVFPVAEMALIPEGLNQMLDWVQDYRPECVPDALPGDMNDRALALFPHAGIEADQERELTDNELLVELGGRSCYHSYGLKAGRKSNAEYIQRMLFPEDGILPHASVSYHAKMSFFVAGISRRVSHELIRHYVGADRTEEGSPSQESTRYTFHPGHFIVPPRVLLAGEETVEEFRRAMQSAYDAYLRFIESETEAYRVAYGAEPKMIDRKRIYEAAAGLLPMQAATSLLWTANPSSLAKMFRERANAAADLEFQNLATAWQSLCQKRWPNLFK
jgi:thymidylate synthase (FAD)